MVMLDPEPEVIIISCPPEVAFSINHTFDNVKVPADPADIVIVQVESSEPVYFKYIERPSSVEPSATTVAWSSAFVVIASVP
jgi:hypothetical protein